MAPRQAALGRVDVPGLVAVLVVLPMMRCPPQDALLRRAGAAWRNGDAGAVRDSLAGVAMAPDYIVLAAKYARRIDAADIGFSDQATIGKFVILKRR